MSLAWLCYVPVPGLQAVAVVLRPDDPQVRFHAWQGLFSVLGGWLVLALLGFLAQLPAIQATVGFVALWCVVTFAGILLWAGIGAARGRFPRVPGAYQLARALRL